MTADLIFFNGRVRTMNPVAPFAEAIAVKDGVILGVGSNAEMQAFCDDATQQVDAAGRTILPGLIDSHVHLFQGSAELDFLPLGGVTDLNAVRPMVLDYALERPDEPLILGVGAFYDLFQGINTTPRIALDEIVKDRPLAVLAADLHTVWANTKTLEDAGLLHGADMPEGSTVVMGDDGLAAGLLLETGAFGPALALSRTGGRDMLGYVTGSEPTPAATPQQREADKALLLKGIDHVASHGVTTLHNMDGNFYQLALLSELEAEDRLNVRVQIPFHFKNFDPLSRLEDAVRMHATFKGNKVWSGRVKMFMDGVLESRTALKVNAYPDAPDTHGEAVFDPDHFNEACRIADAAGLQISVHAVGDLAVKRVLDGYEYARTMNGKRDARHRIEHIELIEDSDIARMKALDVVASMQPRHAAFGGFFAPPVSNTIFFPNECARAYAWQKLRRAGIPLTFSTDWPVVPLDPLANMQCALAPLDLGEGWEDQTQGLTDTLSSYTRDNAWLGFQEGLIGQIKSGYFADLTVLSGDIGQVLPKVSDLQVDMTMNGGRIVFERS